MEMTSTCQCYFGLCLLLLALISNSDGTCTFPTDLQSGTWYSSDMGTVTFNSTHFDVSSIVEFGAMSFECKEYDGTKYYVLSNAFLFLSTYFKLAMCFQLTQDSAYKFYYYLLSPVLANTDVNRVLFNVSSYSFTSSETCSITSPTFTNLRVLIRDSFINSTSTNCPNMLAGQYTYSVSTSSCSSTYLDVCTDPTLLEFDYTMCSDKMMFSAAGNLSCVYAGYSGSTSYTIVYNEDSTTDESNYYRYSCVVSEMSGNYTNSTVYPRACPENQTSTTIFSPGYAIEFTGNYTCPTYNTTSNSLNSTNTSTDSSGNNTEVVSAGAVVAIIIAFLILLGAGLVVGIWYYCKIRKAKVIPNRDEPDVLPRKSPLVNNKEMDVAEEKKKEKQSKDKGVKEEETIMAGRVSPFLPFPTVSELALDRFAPDDIDDDDGGMTLEATTPGITEGRRTQYGPDAHWNDQGSRTSLPVYSEVGGDTPEPTRLSEVQTRMSEISITETNLDEPIPFTMTRATMNIPEESTVSPIDSPQPEGTAVTPRATTVSQGDFAS